MNGTRNFSDLSPLEQDELLMWPPMDVDSVPFSSHEPPSFSYDGLDWIEPAVSTTTEDKERELPPLVEYCGEVDYSSTNDTLSGRKRTRGTANNCTSSTGSSSSTGGSNGDSVEESDAVKMAKYFDVVSAPEARYSGEHHRVGKWSADEDDRLRHAVELFKGQWKRVSGIVGTRTSQQCLHRWRKTLLPGIRRTRWTPEEDDKLRAAVAALGTHWTQVCQLVPGRNDVQCRERWVNVLDPSLNKSNWSESEDEELIDTIEKYGYGKWAKITKVLKHRHRTDYHARKRAQQLVRAGRLNHVKIPKKVR